MRLLNVRTMKMENFMGKAPSYAILSHTWNDEELTFQEMSTLTRQIKQKRGYAKIEGAVKICLKNKMDYLWIDTVCIDKTSSAELSEAINSMWRWYGLATVCYVYLEDIPMQSIQLDNIGRPKESETLSSSRWFTRGWTLQELIAPRAMVFFSTEWSQIGTKDRLRELLTSVTKIDPEVLRTGRLGSASIAQRISWAANRKTTRIEDMAYCLLGILNVNMPLLYGEGEKAFQRLQEEVIKNSSDLSIFTWREVGESRSAQYSYRGLLARNPSEFGPCGGISASCDFAVSNPYTVTNHGLSLRLDLHVKSEEERVYIADLGCKNSEQNFEAIYLKRLSPGGDQFARIRAHQQAIFPILPNFTQREQIFVRQNISIPVDHPTTGLSGFFISSLKINFSPNTDWGTYIRLSNLSSNFKQDGTFIWIVKPLKPALAVLIVSTTIGNRDRIEGQPLSFVLLLGYNKTEGAWWKLELGSETPPNTDLAQGGSTDRAYRATLSETLHVALGVENGLHEDRLVVKVNITATKQ